MSLTETIYPLLRTGSTHKVRKCPKITEKLLTGILSILTTQINNKDQESIQSNTAPDPGHHRKVTKTQENSTYKRAKRSANSQQETTRLQRTDKTVCYKRQIKKGSTRSVTKLV